MLLGVTRAAGTGADRGITVGRGEEDTARALGWVEAADVVLDPRGSAVRTTPSRRTFRMEVALEGGGTAVVFRKVHTARSGGLRLRRNPARIEWERLHELADRGFRVPAPVLLAECGVGCALVTRAVPGSTQLDQWLAGAFLSGELAEHRRDLARILSSVAGLVARLHAEGFFHRDLYLCHLFLATPGEEPTIIDLQRARHRRRPRRRWFVKDLAALHSSTPKSVSGGRRLRFLRTYLEQRKLSADWKTWARKVLAKSRRIARHVPKHG